ncbi:hypothetical protein [Pedobacter helvus]|uniref:Transmembrane protein n=1 Tax=Pedobacter helvus TaxID=2563444 RepID=A0ABW9JN93_9SPHI|nr:hypothetical protein [Pedobacter ureilyticus]
MKYIFLFLPPIFVYLTNADPVLSFFISWGSSLLYILLSASGKIAPLPKDRKWSAQLFRPFILSQCLFFGYHSISNVFYFMDTMGYYYFEKTILPVDIHLLKKLASIQNYVLFAHATYLCGALPQIKKYNFASPFKINIKVHYYLIYAIAMLVTSYILNTTPLALFASYLNALGTFLALLYAVDAIKNKTHLPFAIVLVCYLMLNALLSGMKENIILIIIFLMANLYTLYRWKPIALFAPFLAIFFYYYPSLNNNYRKLAWDEGVSTYDAASEVLKDDNIQSLTIEENNWVFLTNRLSEISMAVDYFDYVPDRHPYYGFDIIIDGIKLLVPRALFPDKGSPDILAMKRATDAGAIQLNENDYTSAKPQTLPDAYMSGGLFGVIITFFLFGWLSTRISIWCEKLFGGYEIGSILIFQSFFSLFNKGGCFENLIGSLFWSLILVTCFHLFLKNKKIIVPKTQNNLK